MVLGRPPNFTPRTSSRQICHFQNMCFTFLNFKFYFSFLFLIFIFKLIFFGHNLAAGPIEPTAHFWPSAVPIDPIVSLATHASLAGLVHHRVKGPKVGIDAAAPAAAVASPSRSASGITHPRSTSPAASPASPAARARGSPKPHGARIDASAPPTD